MQPATCPRCGSGDFRIIAETTNQPDSDQSVACLRCGFGYAIPPSPDVQRPAATTFETIRCPVCGSNDTDVVDERDVPEGRLINVQCARCGHVYLNPRASAEVYEQFYREGFGERFNAVDVRANHEQLARAAQPKTDRLMRFLAPDLRPDLDVFEIGSGYGNLLAALRDHYGASVTGIEPDPMGSVVARDVFGLETRRQTLQEFLAGHDGKQYDLIVMHHVLEHLLDMNAVGIALRQLLKPDGRLYLGVPNVSAMTFPKRLFFRFPHVSNFTPFSLFLFLWRNGFKILRHDHLSKPLAVIAAHVAAPLDMEHPRALIRAGLPIGRVRRRIAWRDIYHRGRLFIRNHRGKVLPASVKRVLRTILKKPQV